MEEAFFVVVDVAQKEHPVPLSALSPQQGALARLLSRIGAAADAVVENVESQQMDDASLHQLTHKCSLRVRERRDVTPAYNPTQWSWCSPTREAVAPPSSRVAQHSGRQPFRHGGRQLPVSQLCVRGA
jgi:hypothetical protein